MEKENFFVKNETQLLLHLMAFLVYSLFKIYFDERNTITYFIEIL